MTLSAGFRLGPYEILSPLGAGGMGEVYRAKDSRLSRDVAIKVLPESLAADAAALARFEREAKAVAALSHPNILGIFDFGSQDGVAYAAMELLEGESLRSRLENGAIPQRRAVEIAIQIAKGLAAAHEKGIVHRDLKPENLFLTRDGRLKILDFGLAKVYAPEKAATSAPTTPAGTEPGTVMGTVGYMSPEQVLGKDVDQRTDIFSFGAVLFEMLSGVRAFKKNSAVETMNAILKDEPPELSETGKQISPSLDRIVRHCLEKNPESRFHSASDLAFDLESLSGSTSSTAAGRVAADRRSSLLRRLAFGITALALLATAYFVGRGRSAPPVPTFQRLTYRPQFMTNARFTSDGRTVVFSAAPEGNRTELFIKDAQSPLARTLQLPDTRLLSVSSKGELAVLSQARYRYQRIYRGTLARMPIGEASPRELLKDVTEAEWSPDGSELAIVRRVDGVDRLEFPIGKVLVSTTGYLSDVRISPDGSRIAFMMHPVDGDDRGNVEIIDRTGHVISKSTDYAGEEGVAWLPNGRRVLFSSSGEEGADLSIRSLDTGGHVRNVLVNSESLCILDVAADGRYLVSSGTGRASVMAGAQGESAERDLSWFDYSVADGISRDGRSVLFTDDSAVAGPNYAACLRKTDGSPAVRLGEGNGYDLSSDGNWVLAAIYTTPPRLAIYPTGAGEPREISFKGFDSYDIGQVVHDGRQVFFCGVRAGSKSRCYMADVGAGEPRPVTPEGTSLGKISPDGSAVVARVGSGGYSIFPIAGGAPRPVPEINADDENIVSWDVDGRSMLLFRIAQVPARVERLELATGRRTLVREIGPVDRAGVSSIVPVGFSADGKSYAYSFFRQGGYLFTVDGVR